MFQVKDICAVTNMLDKLLFIKTSYATRATIYTLVRTSIKQGTILWYKPYFQSPWLILFQTDNFHPFSKHSFFPLIIIKIINIKKNSFR